MKGLNDKGRWLLGFMLSRHPIGIASVMPVPMDAPDGVGMATVRGLERRGWVREASAGVFYLTAQGKLAAEQSK